MRALSMLLILEALSMSGSPTPSQVAQQLLRDMMMEVENLSRSADGLHR